ncbi:ABC transporter permease [Yinghuangia seranimata]|uniref:ABC transporter permease n=1 Tax=Yinghuangia seranimata TaxID=408067 RepID=UPI00248C833A|nr:ABC transporter permease [Yinghuangia seranimata]MDI2129753.1 ABC transporter permease [Yinghuangia seranimata]
MNRNLLRFLAGRVVGMVLVLFATSFVVFSAVHLAPGDPVTFLMRGRPITPESRAVLTAQYHLDQPFLKQYFLWLGDVLSGDFGRSVQFHQDISTMITDKLPTTLFLVVYAMVIIAVLGLALGILSALRPGLIDKIVLVWTGMAVAIPSYIAAIVLLSIFSVKLGWFPIYGAGEGFSDMLWHLTLPAFALALMFAGLLARVTRASMLDELSREHVEVARARGVPEGQVIRKHVLRNALGPIVTVVGTMVASMLVATSIVETAFSVQGVGSLLIKSVTAKDFPVVQAVTLLVVAVFMIANLIVDLLQPLIDPRVALGGDQK